MLISYNSQKNVKFSVVVEKNYTVKPFEILRIVSYLNEIHPK